MTESRGEFWRHQTSPARTHLAHDDDQSERCFLLLEGVVIREKILEHGQRQIIGFALPGELCALSALSDGSLHDQVVALSQVSYVSICRRWLLALSEQFPDIRRAVWQEILRDAAISAAWTANVSGRPAYQRLAHLFCELEARSQAAGRTGPFKWVGTQADLGAAAGLSLVHVNRTLSQLNADGLVSRGTRVRIEDLDKLASVAGFDPTYLSLGRVRLSDILLSRCEEWPVHSSAICGPHEDRTASGNALAHRCATF